MGIGECYMDAFREIVGCRCEPPTEAVRLVHGFPRLTRPCAGQPVGTRYGHAWLELTAEGGFVVCRNMAPRLDILCHVFYAEGQIDERWVRRYTPADAVRLALEHGHYGPWHEGPPDAYLPT